MSPALMLAADLFKGDIVPAVRVPANESSVQ